MPHEASRTIHGYTLIRRLGDGSFGEVWEASAPGGIPAAVKLIHCTRSQAAAQLELDALEVLKSLKHAYLLPTYASFIDSDQVVIAMELADGTLRQRLQFCKSEGKPGLPIGELLHYMRQAGDALDYLHSQKKLHRDVKPDNLLVFLGPPPYVKVGDCGLLREHADTDETMTSLGTPPYMALEVWRRNACSQSDLYSLVVSYVELRQGKRPFNPSPGVSLFDAQLNHEPDLAGLEEAETEVVRRGLAKDPRDRHETCLDFVEELERALQVRPGKFRPAEQVGLAVNKVRPDQAPLAPSSPSSPSSPSTPKAVPSPRPTRTMREESPATLGTHMPSARERDALPTPSLPAEGAEDSWVPERPVPTGMPASEALETGRARTPPPSSFTTWVAVALVMSALGAVGYLAMGAFKRGPSDDSRVELPDKADKGISADKDQGSDKDRTPVKDKDDNIRVSEKDKDKKADDKQRVDPAKDKLVHKNGSGVAPVLKDKDKDGSVTRKDNGKMQGTGSAKIDLPKDGGKEKEKPKLPDPPKYPLPKGYAADAEKKVQRVREKEYYICIVRKVNEEKVRFFLVFPGDKENWEPFYLMENKAWNSLFQAVVGAEGDWTRGGKKDFGKTDLPATSNPKLPVLRVRLEEAVKFAEAFGGRLPTAEEWDHAAARDEGATKPPEKAAVNLRAQGPRPVDDEKHDDVSRFGIRDLLGNGREWTSTKIEAAAPMVELRGRSYTAGAALLPAALKAMSTDNLTQRQDPAFGSAYTGFRVLIPVP